MEVTVSRRIIGQCNISDFKYLEHLAEGMARNEPVDTTNLTRRQKVAVIVLQHFQECGEPFKVLLKIREVIVWADSKGGSLFEYKLLNPRDQETFTILRTMSPKK